MPFNIIRDDITKVEADAIVNTANPLPVYASGTDQKIYEAAGAADLLKARREIGFIEPGKAAITKAYQLPARYIIHTVGPVWVDGEHGEEETLKSCLRESLRLAQEHDCRSVALPLIATGVYGFPRELALKIFTSVIYDFLMESDMLVTLVVYDEESYRISSKIFGHIEDYLSAKQSDIIEEYLSGKLPVYNMNRHNGMVCDLVTTVPFQRAVKVTGPTFHEYLWDLIVSSNLSNPEIYRGANITKQHFSKIISNKEYNPSKNTICALAISLKLDIEKLEQLLEKAGYSLSKVKPFDLAVRYFVENRMYNIVDDNFILFDNGLELLGTIS